LKTKKELSERESKTTIKKTPQILLYGNFLLKIKKDKWNEILLDESDSHDGISNVVLCPVNIYEINLIYTHEV
jgi:hypothetical protein